MEKDLIAHGRGIPPIVSTVISSNNIYTHYHLGNPVKQGLDTNVGQKSFIRIKNLKSNKIILSCIKNYGLVNRLINGKYFVTNTEFLPVNKDLYFQTLSNSEKNKSLFIKYTRKDRVYNVIGPTENSDNIIPKEFNFDLKNKYYFAGRTNSEYYFFNKDPIIYQISSGKTIYLKMMN